MRRTIASARTRICLSTVVSDEDAADAADPAAADPAGADAGNDAAAGLVTMSSALARGASRGPSRVRSRRPPRAADVDDEDDEDDAAGKGKGKGNDAVDVEDGGAPRLTDAIRAAAEMCAGAEGVAMAAVSAVSAICKHDCVFWGKSGARGWEDDAGTFLVQTLFLLCTTRARAHVCPAPRIV